MTNDKQWIKHDGSRIRPVDKKVRVDVRLSNGNVLFNWQADRLFWRGAINNIIEYRLHVASPAEQDHIEDSLTMVSKSQLKRINVQKG